MKKNSGNDSLLSLIMILYFGLMLLPVIGFFKCFSNNQEEQQTGVWMLIGGLLIWLIVFTLGSN